MAADPRIVPAAPRPTVAIPALALRLPEAAAALAVSKRTLWTWAQNGDVPSVRIGGIVLFPTADLARWLSERAAQQPADASGGAE